MPMSFESTAGGTGYADIRVGEGHAIHQAMIDVAAVAGDVDDDGYIPPGLPLQADGTPIGAVDQVAKYVVGPEPVEAGDANHFGNAFVTGALNQDMIEDNLGRALTANEIAALADGGFKLV